MKITKKQLKRIIKEEKAKLLNETKGGVGIGFAGWEPNSSADFAKAYGKDAKVLHDFGSNARRQSQMQEVSNHRLEQALSDFGYRMSEEINGIVSQHVRGNWFEDPEVMDAIQAMLREVQEQYRHFSNNQVLVLQKL